MLSLLLPWNHPPYNPSEGYYIILLFVKEMSFLGHYKWQYAGSPTGFDVSLRPNGLFFSGLYGPGTYAVQDNQLSVDWKKYGKYQFTLTNPSTGLFEGAAVGDASQWRKMQFVSGFTPSEQALMGEHGFGTEWNFEWEKGAFPVLFYFDAHNHFVCPQFPSHSHWSMEENRLLINWEKYGNYEMLVDAASMKMEGCKQGQPTNWRRASFIRSLTAADGAPPAHDHSHHH